ncbi:hypothetical protein [Jiella marina]|uniref:hypothetical protein n=1 Tax=Jiella sp. LLJ827 TaxID=2917712 RepID=UPI002100826E|nr:hypothetical protein [Jiella sp. LLJ827]MCQ0989384.1 hypothetical protein [Jiella sp. LLJ827]
MAEAMTKALIGAMKAERGMGLPPILDAGGIIGSMTRSSLLPYGKTIAQTRAVTP